MEAAAQAKKLAEDNELVAKSEPQGAQGAADDWGDDWGDEDEAAAVSEPGRPVAVHGEAKQKVVPQAAATSASDWGEMNDDDDDWAPVSPKPKEAPVSPKPKEAAKQRAPRKAATATAAAAEDAEDARPKAIGISFPPGHANAAVPAAKPKVEAAAKPQSDKQQGGWDDDEGWNDDW